MAMQLVGTEFTEKVMEYKDIWLPARTIVQRAIESRLQVESPKFCAYHAYANKMQDLISARKFVF